MDWSKPGSSPHARGAPPAPPWLAPSRRDHPRMRGEHGGPRPDAGGLHGIIPACAGSTLATATRRAGFPGSSPHARGAHLASLSSTSPDGIIPACAGSTITAVSVSYALPGSSPHARGAPATDLSAATTYEDHPRMHGEHHCIHDASRMGQGIIPACAGSTLLLHGLLEHMLGIIPACAGSTRLRVSAGERGTGIIPACAGSTLATATRRAGFPGSSPHARGARLQPCRCRRPFRDHPRMRGEHQLRARPAGPVDGIIPACAGSTSADLTALFWTAGSSPHARGARPRLVDVYRDREDHPRMRGEHP